MIFKNYHPEKMAKLKNVKRGLKRKILNVFRTWKLEIFSFQRILYKCHTFNFHKIFHNMMERCIYIYETKTWKVTSTLNFFLIINISEKLNTVTQKSTMINIHLQFSYNSLCYALTWVKCVLHIHIHLQTQSCVHTQTLTQKETYILSIYLQSCKKFTLFHPLS